MSSSASQHALPPITLLRNAHAQWLSSLGEGGGTAMAVDGPSSSLPLTFVPARQDDTDDNPARNQRTGMVQAARVVLSSMPSPKQEDQLPLDAPCGYKDYSTRALVYFYLHRGLEHAAYLQQATAASMKPISFIDRKDILAYLEGGLHSTSVHVKSGAVRVIPADGKSEIPAAVGSRMSKGDVVGEGLTDSAKSASTARTVVPAADKESIASASYLKGPDGRKLIVFAHTECCAGGEGSISDDVSRDLLESPNKMGLINLHDQMFIDTGQILLHARLRYCPNMTVEEGRAAAIEVSEALKHTTRTLRDRKSVLSSRLTSRPLGGMAERLGSAFFRDRLGVKEGSGVGKRDAKEGRGGVLTTSASSSSSSKAKSGVSSGKGSLSSGKSVSGSAGSLLPIIIVPNVPTATVNLYNIKEFLIDKKYIPPEELRVARGNVKPERVVLERSLTETSSGLLKFEVVDSVQHFKSSDWDRVVAVFTTGQEWAFKTWKYTSPVDLFNRTCGFAVKFIDDPTRGPVDGWNVTVMGIHRHRQHMNVTVVYSFWSRLEAWIAKNKSVDMFKTGS